MIGWTLQADAEYVLIRFYDKNRVIAPINGAFNSAVDYTPN
jgi:hypothetical protein